MSVKQRWCFCIRLEHTLETNKQQRREKKKWGDRECESKWESGSGIHSAKIAREKETENQWKDEVKLWNVWNSTWKIAALTAAVMIEPMNLSHFNYKLTTIPMIVSTIVTCYFIFSAVFRDVRCFVVAEALKCNDIFFFYV